MAPNELVATLGSPEKVIELAQRASGRPKASMQYRCCAMLLDAFQLTCKQMGSNMEAKWVPNCSLEASWSLLAS